MATIRKYSNGRWQAIVRRKGHPAVSKVFSSKADAERWYRLTESEVERGLFIDRTEAEQTQVSELIDRYLQEITPHKASSRQETQRLSYLKRHLGNHSVARLASKHIATYRDWRLQEGRAGATVVKELNSLSHVLDTAAKEWGLPLANNPVKLVRRPPTSRGRDRRVDATEFQSLLQFCHASRAPQLGPIVVLAVETGMRLGELLSLTWADVNLQSRVATLDRTKNGEMRRVPLSSRAVQTLQLMLRHITNDRIFWRWTRPDSFENAWKRAVKKANLNGLRFHDLRHEATSRFFEAGFGMIEVASITGHKTLQMLRRYTHLRAEDLALRMA